MHEFSIAEALVEQVQRRLRPDAHLQAVGVRAGPMRMIEPAALQLAWQALVRDTVFPAASLELEMLLWQMTCTACGRTWASEQLEYACACGAPAAPQGSDELTLMWLDIQ